jgi:hypothetical protein
MDIPTLLDVVLELLPLDQYVHFPVSILIENIVEQLKPILDKCIYNMHLLNGTYHVTCLQNSLQLLSLFMYIMKRFDLIFGV